MINKGEVENFERLRLKNRMLSMIVMCAIERQATRLAGCADLSPEVLEQLTTADIP